jgi:heptosyltransferase-2
MKSILIVKFGAIGDVVMAIAAVRAFTQPGDTVDWLCGQAVAPLLACYPWINPIVADDKAFFYGSAPARVREIVRIWRLLSRRRYDLCATLYYDPRYRVFTLPVRAARKLHLDKQDRARRILPGRHHSRELLRILSARPDDADETSIPPARLEHLPPSPLAPRTAPVRVAIVPAGASNMLRQQTLRRWPVEHYVELTRQLLARGWEVVLIGGPDDAWVQPAFTPLACSALTDTIGTLTLPQVVAAFADSDVAVSHDTGPLHLAGITPVRIVALFGPTDPASFLPRGQNVTAIWGGDHLSCRPCYDGQDFAPCTSNLCLQEITPAMALSQIDALFAGPGPQTWQIVQPFNLLGASSK